jgi:hypothetical protein
MAWNPAAHVRPPERFGIAATIPAVGLARAAGYDGGMYENPYQSPLTEPRRDERPPPPLWRIILAFLLMVFGILILTAAIAGIAVAFLWNDDRVTINRIALYVVCGAVLIWAGFRLCRKKSGPQNVVPPT